MALAGAAAPLHGPPPALALGSNVVHRAEVAVALVVLTWPPVRAMRLAWDGLIMFVPADDETEPERPGRRVR